MGIERREEKGACEEPEDEEEEVDEAEGGGGKSAIIRSSSGEKEGEATIGRRSGGALVESVRMYEEAREGLRVVKVRGLGGNSMGSS